mgnify:CR=1 FL=1
MASSIYTNNLETDGYPTTGIDLPVAAWTTGFQANPNVEFIQQTDWSGGLYQKLFPVERRMAESPLLSNMAWEGNCWTANGYEIRAGPLRTAAGGTAITAAAVQFFAEFNNLLYFASGAKKYSIAAGNPSEVDAGGSATVTDIKVIDDKLVVCLGTISTNVVRQFGGSSWSAGTYCARTVAFVDTTKYWASNPTSGSPASYLYWGSGAGQKKRISKQNVPITQLVEFDEQLFIFKADGIWVWIDAALKSYRLQSLPYDTNNGVAHAMYNDCLYFSSGQGLHVFRGTGPSESVPLPELLNPAQIGKVYSIQSVDKALLIGFKGFAYLMFEDPNEPGVYYWHYIAANSGKTFRDIYYTNTLTSMARPRIFFAFSTDSTNNIQYIEFVDEQFVPYEYAASSYTIFPGLYTGPEMFDMWVKNILCGTRNCDANKKITFAWSINPFDTSPTWTDIGSPVTGNGFQTVTPTADVEGNIIWLRITIITNVTTTSPILDFYRVRYYPRDPAKRTWSFPVLMEKGGSYAAGGRQISIDTVETALYNARNQTSPCLLNIPSQDVTDVKVFVDIRYNARRADARRDEITGEIFTLICQEAV